MFENSRNFTENGFYFTNSSAKTQSLKIKEKEKFTEYLSILRPKDLLCFDIFASYGCSKNITSPFSDSSLSCFKRLIFDLLNCYWIFVWTLGELANV